MHATTCITGLIVLLAAAVHVVPLVDEAQQAANIPRIGLLSPTSLSDPRTPRVLDAFRLGLREPGYVEGQNIVIESRWAEGKYDRLRDLAAELVRLKVNVIVSVDNISPLRRPLRRRSPPREPRPCDIISLLGRRAPEEPLAQCT
jgi:hypothetical protein